MIGYSPRERESGRGKERERENSVTHENASFCLGKKFQIKKSDSRAQGFFFKALYKSC